MKSICVFCGSSDSVHADYKTAAFQLGIVLAKRRIRLVYGGGKTGLMGEVANGALSAGGEVIGIIIPSMNTPALAHTGLTRMDVAPDMHGRKARMHELSDGYIALPGGFGTWDELFETITWAQTTMDHAVNEGFVFEEHRKAVFCEMTSEKLLDEMSKYQHPREAVKRWLKKD